MSFNQADRNTSLVQTLVLQNTGSTAIEGAAGELVQGNMRITCEPSVVTDGQCTIDISQLPTGKAYFVAQRLTVPGLPEKRSSGIPLRRLMLLSIRVSEATR